MAPPKSFPGLPKPLTDDEKFFQQQTQLEVQLNRLKTEYVRLAKDQELAQYSKANKLKSQTRQLAIFERERHEILTNLNVAKCKEKEDERTADKLENIFEEYCHNSDNVTNARQTLDQIKDQIRMVKKRVVELSTKQVTDRQIQDREWRAAKIVESLENKLDVQIKKFCAIVGKNIEMRHEIDYLLSDRNIFLIVWNKFVERLVKGKEMMMNLVEQASIAYDQREEWVNKLQVLRAKANYDMNHRIQDMRQLKMKLDDKQKLETFLHLKSQKRAMKDLIYKQKIKRMEQYKAVKDKVRHYEKLVEDVTNFTNETRLSVIGLRFRHQEQTNFMHFQFIIEQIKKMESVNDQLTSLHTEIDELRVLHEIRRLQQAAKLDELENKLKDTKTDADNTEIEFTNLCNYNLQLFKGINKLFAICKCSDDPLMKLLGEKHEITKFNVQFYLKILEDAILDLLLRNNYKSPPKRKQKVDILGPDLDLLQIYDIEDVMESSPCSLCAEKDIVEESPEKVTKVFDRKTVYENYEKIKDYPEIIGRVHNISKCNLPKAREMIQRRYIN